MSKLERPLIEKYWKQVGGSIIFFNIFLEMKMLDTDYSYLNIHQ
jgi:hypothetical protein